MKSDDFVLEKRVPKEKDQEQIEIAYELIRNLMQQHPEIEPSLWAAAVWSVLVNGYKACGFNYKMFREETSKAVKHYEQWFT